MSNSNLIARCAISLEHIALSLDAIRRQNLAATTRVISVTLGKQDASVKGVRFREIRLNTPEVMGLTWGQNPHYVTCTALGEGGELPNGDYLVRVRIESKDLDTWDWHDWRRL